MEPYMLDRQYSPSEWDRFCKDSSLNRSIHRVAGSLARRMDDTFDAVNQHILEIAYRIEDATIAQKNNSVWHQMALYFNRECHCFPCERAKEAQSK